MVDPEAFTRSIDEVLASTGDPMDVHLVTGRSMGGDELLAWWDGAHRAMVGAFADADPTAPRPVVRAADGCPLVHLRTTDGDLGPRTGRL